MASSTTLFRVLVISFLIACSVFGGYAGFGTGGTNGLFAAIEKSTGSPDTKEKYIPGGPAPYKTTYTGITALDNQLLILIAFFTIILDAPQTEEVVWVFRYIGVHFLAGWILISLEGLRHGNRGRIVSWTGTLGAIFQNITYTVTVPIYLVIHLLTSPISNSKPLASDLSVDTEDLVTLPFVATWAFGIPMFMMSLPSPGTLSPSAHYTWNALWQIFPITQHVYHWIYKRVTAPLHFKQTFPLKIGDIYRLILVLSIGSQILLLALAVTPGHLVPDAVARLIPGISNDTFDKINLTNAFVPYWPWNSPIVGVETMGPAGEGLAELLKMFLQWDMYCGNIAILAWAVFLHKVALPEKDLMRSTLPRSLLWSVLGGPVAAATVLLWERDSVLRVGQTATDKVRK